MVVRISIVLAGACLAAVGSSAWAGPGASRDAVVVDLGALGGSASFATALNERGWVAGAADTAAGTQHAFLWRDGVMHDLGTLPGGANSQASGLNELGDVVGSSDGPSSTLRATAWFRGRAPRDLEPLDAPTAVATDINDRRQVVGLAGALSPRGFIWQKGASRDLGSLGEDTRATAINSRGEVVGASVALLGSGAQTRPFLWARGTMSDLGLPSGTAGGEALDVNDQGWVVGGTFAADGPALAYRDGVRVDLALTGRATAVNDRGQIVGSRCLDQPLCNVSHAFLFEAGVVVDLNDLLPAGSGWVLSVASDINERGQIVGVGSHDGARRAFLLTLAPG